MTAGAVHPGGGGIELPVAIRRVQTAERLLPHKAAVGKIESSPLRPRRSRGALIETMALE